MHTQSLPQCPADGSEVPDAAALPGLHGYCKNIVVRRARLELLVLVSAQDGCWEPNMSSAREANVSLALVFDF